jgi:hypothetical protein
MIIVIIIIIVVIGSGQYLFHDVGSGAVGLICRRSRRVVGGCPGHPTITRNFIRFMPGLVRMYVNIQGSGRGDSNDQLDDRERSIKPMATARAGFVSAFDRFKAARAVGSSFHQI